MFKVIARSVGLALLIATFACVANPQDDDDVDIRQSALAGAGGSIGGGAGAGTTGSGGTGNSCPAGQGGQTGSPVRGYTRADGTHAAVFRNATTGAVMRATGTPLGIAASIGGNLAAGAAPWGYKRHDGPDVVLYVDQNFHVHELGSLDFDFALSFGINAPPAAPAPPLGAGPVPDVIGYVRSSNVSAIVYRRGSDNHVIEVKSNFSSQPPWLVSDLTAAAGTLRVANKGSAFPFVKADGLSSVVYIADDNHIHELRNDLADNWFDADLHVATGETVLPSSDPWAYVRSDTMNAVVFVGTDARVHQFGLVTGANWGREILPSAEANTGLFRRPSGYVRADGLSAVVYASRTSVRELRLTGLGWVDSKISGSCTFAATDQVFGHLAPGNVSSVLFRGARGVTNGHFAFEDSKTASGPWTETFFF